VSLEVTDEEHVHLERIVAFRSISRGLVHRVQLILWSEVGLPFAEVGGRVKVGGSTMRHPPLRFRKPPLCGASRLIEPGRLRTHDDERIAQLRNTKPTGKADGRYARLERWIR
jgi:hypothetical protein